MGNRPIVAKSILLFFVLCGVADFVWAYIHGRSILGAVVAVLLGLFGTAWYFFLLGGWKNSE